MIVLASLNEFFGSLHPLVVHLPIGIIIAALALEFWKYIRPAATLKAGLKILWLLGAVSSIVAVIFGLLLANKGHYIGQGLSIHKWTGIITAIATIGLAIHYYQLIDLRKARQALIGIVGITLMINGHFGGEMTHGEGYLIKHSPFSNTISSSSLLVDNWEDRDSILVFEDMINPVFQNKCVSCHNENLSRGSLDMTTYESLLDDTFGDNIVKGSAMESNIMKRVLLPLDHEKHMPPMGNPLTFVEKMILQLWIDQGANTTQNLVDMESPDHLKALLKSTYNIDFTKKSFYEKVKIGPLEESVMQSILDADFNATRLAADNYLIDVTKTGKTREVSQDQINTLLSAAEHVTWLDLAGTETNDDHLQVIGQLPNLTRLKLQNTQITDVGISNISGLKHLASLNLYGTSISNNAIEELGKMKSLEHLYLWQTEVDSAGVERLMADIPGIEIVLGL